MIRIYKDEDIEISFSELPKVDIRYILPWTLEEEAKDIRLKPFQCQNSFTVEVYEFDSDEEFSFTIPAGYKWDGATIPRFLWRLIGSNTDNSFLIPSCIHDMLCENHHLVDDRRNLSSKIFKALLISQGVGKFKAQTMYLAVDNFQKLCGWKCK